MIRTLIFDLGRVLVPFDFQIGYKLMSEHCGLAPDEIRRRISSDGLVHGFESGEFDEHEFHHRIEALLETKIDYPRFCDLWYSVFLPHTLIPESLLMSLRRNYRTVLLSNTNPIHYSMLAERFSILEHFDARILSHEVGAMKPLPKIYQAAIEAAQCRPEECFFTDDIPEYVAGACAMGIDAVQFQNCDQLMAELRGRGVVWQD